MKVNKKISTLIQQGAKLVKDEQSAKAVYDDRKEKRKEHMTKLADAGAVKGMEQKTARVTRVVREQVNVNVGYAAVLADLVAEFPQIADRADELVAEARKRTTSLKVVELENA